MCYFHGNCLKTEVLHSAVNYLSRREHSALELMDKLKTKGYSSTDISVIIEYLQEKNYQSDQRFAECSIRNRASRGYGWLYIKQMLKQKGVCENIINEEAKNQQIDWYLQAELAYNKRFAGIVIKDEKDKAKRLRFMQSRGFTLDQIFTLINK